MATPQRAAPAVMEPRATATVDFVSAEERSAPEGTWSSAVADVVGCESPADVTVAVAVRVGHEEAGMDWLRFRLVVLDLDPSSRAYTSA